MNSKMIFDHMRPKTGVTQSQVDALYRIVASGAKIEDIAAFVGMTTQQEEPKVVQSKWVLSQRSLDRLKGVHPDLVKVVKRAIEISEYDFHGG